MCVRLYAEAWDQVLIVYRFPELPVLYATALLFSVLCLFLQT